MISHPLATVPARLVPDGTDDPYDGRNVSVDVAQSQYHTWIFIREEGAPTIKIALGCPVECGVLGRALELTVQP